MKQNGEVVVCKPDLYSVLCVGNSERMEREEARKTTEGAGALSKNQDVRAAGFGSGRDWVTAVFLELTDTF